MSTGWRREGDGQRQRRGKEEQGERGKAERQRGREGGETEMEGMIDRGSERR